MDYKCQSRVVGGKTGVDEGQTNQGMKMGNEDFDFLSSTYA